MGIALATIGLATCIFLALLAFVSVSVHILKCTEHNHVRNASQHNHVRNASQNAQERFSWASVGRSIRWAIKCILALRR